MDYLTKKERDCLITIKESSNGPFPVKLSEIAERMQVKPPTVSDLLKRLLDKGLITKKGGMVILSRDGEEAYRDITLVHRAMETLLFRAGLSKEEACREVKEFDYLMSRETAERILHLMGDPDTCPHGQPVVVKE